MEEYVICSKCELYCKSVNQDYGYDCIDYNTNPHYRKCVVCKTMYYEDMYGSTHYTCVNCSHVSYEQFEKDGVPLKLFCEDVPGYYYDIEEKTWLKVELPTMFQKCDYCLTSENVDDLYYCIPDIVLCGKCHFKCAYDKSTFSSDYK